MYKDIKFTVKSNGTQITFQIIFTRKRPIGAPESAECTGDKHTTTDY